MPTVRYRLGGFENEQAVIYLEYNDSNMRITAIVVENNLPNPVVVTVTRSSDQVSVSRIFPPGITTFSIVTTITIADLGRGHWGNVSIGMGYPA